MDIYIGLIIFGIVSALAIYLFDKFLASDYDDCYKVQEDSGRAIFGICKGLVDNQEHCSDCPFLNKLTKEKKEND